MIHIREVSEILLLGVVLTLAIGVVLCVFFRSASRGRLGLYACGLGLLLELGMLGVGVWAYLQNERKPQEWVVGWIGTRDELGALKLGFALDSPALTFCAYAWLLALVLLLFRRRSGLAALIGLAGVSLAWFSATPWLCLVGLASCLLAGFIANASTRFLQETGFGALLLGLGCTLLAADGESRLGIACVGLGLFFPALPLPFSRWSGAPREVNETNLVLNLIFPVWALAGLLYRMDGVFASTGADVPLGWAFLAAAAYGVIVSFFQAEWSASWFSWVGALLLAGLAACMSGGFATGAPMLIFGSLGGVVVLLARAHLARNRYWIALGSALAAGLIGFANAGAAWQWIALSLAQPVRAAAVGLAWFFVLSWGFRLSFQAAIRADGTSDAPLPNEGDKPGWIHQAAAAALVVFSLGVVTAGSISGGAVTVPGDSLFHSLLVDFPVTEASLTEQAAIIAWIIFAAALGAGYALHRSGEALDGARARMPGVSRFFQEAAGIPALLARMEIAYAEFARKHRVSLPIAATIARTLEFKGRLVCEFDSRVSAAIATASRILSEGPARATQRAHGGDVRWYLAFGIGIAALMLLHFARI